VSWKPAVASLTRAQDKRLQNPGHTLPEPWDGIAVRHCAAVHALYNNDYASA
jgi:hypothetical protein